MTLSLSMMAPGEVLLRAREAAGELSQTGPFSCAIEQIYPDAELPPEEFSAPVAPDGEAFNRRMDQANLEAREGIKLSRKDSRWSDCQMPDTPAP